MGFGGVFSVMVITGSEFTMSAISYGRIVEKFIKNFGILG